MTIDPSGELCRNRPAGIILHQANPIPGVSALKYSHRPRGAFTRGLDRRVLDVLRSFAAADEFGKDIAYVPAEASVGREYEHGIRTARRRLTKGVHK
jgi:hypothetical protein